MTKRKQRAFLNENHLFLNDDKQKIDWNYIQGILTGTNDPFTFPVAYPAIDLDPKTKKLVYTVSFVIAGSILLSAFIKSNKK
jgi:hypothetical protein